MSVSQRFLQINTILAKIAFVDCFDQRRDYAIINQYPEKQESWTGGRIWEEVFGSLMNGDTTVSHAVDFDS